MRNILPSQMTGGKLVAEGEDACQAFGTRDTRKGVDAIFPYGHAYHLPLKGFAQKAASVAQEADIRRMC